MKKETKNKIRQLISIAVGLAGVCMVIVAMSLDKIK